MNNQKRAEVAQKILDSVAGLDFETAIAAQCDALATSIGGAFYRQGKACAEAEQLIADLAVDMAVRHIRRHWGTIEAEWPQ